MTTTTTKETGMIEDIHAAVRAILSEETARAVDNQARDHAKVLTAQCEAAEAERDVLRAQLIATLDRYTRNNRSLRVASRRLSVPSRATMLSPRTGPRPTTAIV